MKSNHPFNSHPSNGAHTPATGSQSISQMSVPSDSCQAVQIVQEMPVDPGLRIEALVLESVMAALRIHIDQRGYPPTFAEMTQVTHLSGEQIHTLLHILQGQGRLLRSRFGWRATHQASGSPLEALYAYLLIYGRLYGLAPALDEMADALHLSHSILQQYLQQLVAAGHLQRRNQPSHAQHKQARHQRKDHPDNLQLLHADAAMRAAMQAAVKRLCASQTLVDLSGTPFEDKSLADKSPEGMHPVAHGLISSRVSSTAEMRSFQERFTHLERVTHG